MPAFSAVDDLVEVYRQAAAATAAGSKSFYFATRFFPPELMRAAHAVYWFCRYTDDIVDECPSPEVGRRELEAWISELTDGAARRRLPAHPVLRAYLDTVWRYGIPLEYAFELIEGMRMDLDCTRYRTFEELRLFCYRVASVVGLMMCHVIGFEDERDREAALPHAIDLGIAMQLTNILRDVGEDLARDRIYLPLEDMERFGYPEQLLRQCLPTDAFRDLIRFQAQRAQLYYERGNAGIPYLSRRGRFAVKIASDVYRAILLRIEESDYDVFKRRAVVPTGRKYWLTMSNMALPIVRHSMGRLRAWRRVD